MKINLTGIRAAKAMVLRGDALVTKNKVNKKILDAAGVRYSQSLKGLRLEPSALSQVEAYFDESLGRPLREFEEVVDRVSAAKQSNNEKLAKGGVFEQLINIVPLGDLPLIGGQIIPEGTGAIISVSETDLDCAAVNKVVVVENGEMLVQWRLLKGHLPRYWSRGCLVIYKGHGSNQNELVTFLSRLRPDAQVGLYFDYDPAGLAMAYSLADRLECNVDLLAPLDTRTSTLLDIASGENFAKQFSVGASLLKRLRISGADGDRIDVLDRVMTNRLAVTQESLMAHKVPLKIFTLK